MQISDLLIGMTIKMAKDSVARPNITYTSSQKTDEKN
jgi:hypothetical protein